VYVCLRIHHKYPLSVCGGVCGGGCPSKCVRVYKYAIAYTDTLVGRRREQEGLGQRVQAQGRAHMTMMLSLSL